MKNSTKYFSLLLVLVFGTSLMYANKNFAIKSPDGKTVVDVMVDNRINYSVSHLGEKLLAESPISLSLTNGVTYGVNPRVSSSSTKTISQKINPVIYKKNVIEDNYNELTIKFKGNYDLIFRVYDDGVAYRFVSHEKKPFEVQNEEVVYNFPSDNKAYIPYVQLQRNSLEEQFYTSFENTYEYINVSDWNKDRLAFSPILLETNGNKKIAILEADLINYPGMFLYNENGNNSIQGVFAPYPKEITQGGHNMLQGEVQTREPFIAKYDKGTTFPWRAIVIADNDYQLADNDLVYKLATPTSSEIDFSWVKPGKVAWDWWNDWNLYGVDFETGINNETYKYYIDFASQNGIEYVILDEGWAVNLKSDLFDVIPEIDLPELVKYAEERNVGLILWAGYYAFNKDIEGICKHYSDMGIKGFKVDFMDRDDQPMVDFHYKAAEIAAKHKMLLDYHGSYKPTGLQRTFPNVINFEGIHGLEQLKWADENTDQVTYDVTFPYIRMLAGPVDYTQGAMRNATKSNYRPVNNEPMSQGTRCHQLAEYVVFESPLNMMCDSPSNYMKEADCLDFIAGVPTVWDTTKALSGEVGKYLVIAREKDQVWYIGGITNWDERNVDIDLSFLGDDSFEAEIFQDGINANRVARDYKKIVKTVTNKDTLNINMAQGGGFAMKITKK